MNPDTRSRLDAELEELRVAWLNLRATIAVVLAPELERLARLLERALDRYARVRFELRRRIPADAWLYVVAIAASILLGFVVAHAMP